MRSSGSSSLRAVLRPENAWEANNSASKLSSTSAHFVAESPVMTGAGDAVPLTSSVANHNYFHCTDGGILIRKPGTYMAIYSMHVPAMQAVSTRIYLTLNGNVLENSIQDVSTAVGCTTGASAAHLIFHALPNSLLRLESSEELNLTGTGETPHVFRLTLVQL